MYKTASILPANIPIKMAIINMYKTILVSDTISLIGLTDENRTHNHQNHNLELYQLSYCQHGSPSRTRTSDPMINSHLLYQLSYWGITSSS